MTTEQCKEVLTIDDQVSFGCHGREGHDGAHFCYTGEWQERFDSGRQQEREAHVSVTWSWDAWSPEVGDDD